MHCCCDTSTKVRMRYIYLAFVFVSVWLLWFGHPWRIQLARQVTLTPNKHLVSPLLLASLAVHLSRYSYVFEHHSVLHFCSVPQCIYMCILHLLSFCQRSCWRHTDFAMAVCLSSKWFSDDNSITFTHTMTYISNSPTSKIESPGSFLSKLRFYKLKICYIFLFSRLISMCLYIRLYLLLTIITAWFQLPQPSSMVIWNKKAPINWFGEVVTTVKQITVNIK